MYFAFLIDVFSRMIVGWQLACHMRCDLVLDALRMALGTRQPGVEVQLVAHTDQGSQGGFNRSSQHSTERSCDGQAKRVGVGADGHPRARQLWDEYFADLDQWTEGDLYEKRNGGARAK